MYSRFSPLLLRKYMTTLGKVTVQFSGGCELLFGNNTAIVLANAVPSGATLADLVAELRNNYCRERPEQFAQPNNSRAGVRLRPGILALVNDCDAEIVGGEEYAIQEGDTIAFISTLHGG